MDKIIVIKDGERHIVDTSNMNIVVSGDEGSISISDSKSAVEFPLEREKAKKFSSIVKCEVEVYIKVDAPNAEVALEKIKERFADTDIGQFVRKNVSYGPVVEELS